MLLQRSCVLYLPRHLTPRVCTHPLLSIPGFSPAPSNDDFNNHAVNTVTLRLPDRGGPHLRVTPDLGSTHGNPSLETREVASRQVLCRSSWIWTQDKVTLRAVGCAHDAERGGSTEGEK